MGPKIGKRIALHLASNKEKFLLPLIQSLEIVNEKIEKCQSCGNLDEGTICKICTDSNRDNNLICVVEEVSDLIAIERVGDYRGKYHILGGNLSAISGKTIEDLNFESLYKRVQTLQNNGINSSNIEVIIATSATIDGQTTANFLADNLKELAIKVTRFAYGIPVGSELDYLDEGTISIAFKTRREI